MMILLSILAGLYAMGALVVFHGAQTAPEGYEDETGFNVVWQNNRPDVADVACVWEPQQFATA